MQIKSLVPHTLLKKVIAMLLVFLLLGFLIPERRVLPVLGATPQDWNKDTFWFEPWGSSGVHKGFDVFAKEGTPVVSSTDILVVYQGTLRKGGNVVVGLGPKWRIHYFAHLKESKTRASIFSKAGTQIGQVGDTGNAQGKQAHLHYSLLSLVPIPWLIDESTQGYKKAFYLNPIDYFGY